MGDCKCRGAMTVVFSILSVMFLSLACTLAESVRVQGARAKASVMMDLGMFSVFGEYERELLEDYEVFGVDVSYGTGEFKPENLSNRLDEYMKCNTDPIKGAALMGKSLFPMSTEGSSILRVLLLTDEDGKVFQDQVIQNLKSALGTEIATGFLEARKKAEELEKAGETYKEQEKAAERGLLEAERAEQEARRQSEEGKAGEDLPGTIVPVRPGEMALPEPQKPDNPLDLIKKIKKMGILAIVMENPESVSEKKVDKKELPSGRKLEKGDFTWERKNGGLLEAGIFQEYLFSHFSCAVDTGQEGALSYELEYILAGKDNDKGNLKAVVNRLLLLREGVNFLYILSNGEMRRSAELLAAAVSGGVPGLTTAIAAALLAAWAYGESLLDVRILLSGGKVPVVKNAESFRLTLENLGRILEVLKECKNVKGSGLDYREYLQMLFLTGKRSKYPIRAIDLIESSMRTREGLTSFRMDHCAAGLEAEASWEFPLVFAAVPKVFLHVSGEKATYKTKGKFIYGVP